MSDENIRKLRDAAILASKFFTQLASVLGDSNGVQDSQKLSLKESRPQSPQKAGGKLDSNGNAQGQQAGQKTALDGKREKKRTKKEKKEAAANGAPTIKKPLSAYMLYNNNRRPVLRSEYPDLSLPEISKVIGDEWKKLNDDQKNVWTEKARSLRLEYEIEKFNQQKQYTDQANVAQQNGQASQAPKPSASAKKPSASKVGDKRQHTDLNNHAADSNKHQKQQNNDDSSSITSLSDDGGNVQQRQTAAQGNAGDESSDL